MDSPRTLHRPPSPPETQKKIDSAVAEVLEKTGAPSASIAIVRDGRIVYLQAYGDARLEPKRTCRARHALRDRLGVQAVHRGGDPAAAAGRQALAGRQGRKVLPGSHAGERHHRSPAARAHVGLPGLLAAGLHVPVDGRAGNAGGHHGPLGQEAARLRARHEMAVQQYGLRDRGPHRRKGQWQTAFPVPAGAHFHAAADEVGTRLRPRAAVRRQCGRLYEFRARSAAGRRRERCRLAVWHGRAWR